jgi:hypothetical protein
MKKNRVTAWLIVGATCVLLAVTATGQDSNQDLQQKLAAFRESVAQNQAALRQYSWIQKIQLNIKGDLKGTKTESCRYGPDGEVQKTPVSEPAAQQKSAKGLNEDMKDYLERTVSMIERYVPPSLQRLRSVAGQGNASFRQTGPDVIELQFKDYVKKGDTVTFVLDMAAQRISRATVNTYLAEEDKDAISLSVDFQTLPDATNYPASKVLMVPAKKIVVKVDSSNYQKVAN